MKIAILSCFYPYRGGISQFNACLFEELGKHHTVKAFNFSRQYPDFLFPGKTQYVTEDDNAVPVASERLLDTANPFSYGRTARAILDWKPDLVITRYWMSYFAPSLGYVTRRLRKHCKVISVLDNVVPHVADDLLKLRPDAPYTIIQHPLYTHFGEKMLRGAAEKALGLESGKRNILFFGLIREYKGLDILLEAFAGLGKEYQLIIAGEPYGPFDKYQRIIDSIEDNGRIHTFLRYIRDSEVSAYFSAADVVVLPYRSATQSGISSVSYHFEVPMIVTDAGGLKETIGDRGTGIVVHGCSPDIVREAVGDFFADPAARQEFIVNIRKEKERLSWKEFCRRLLEFSEKI